MYAGVDIGGTTTQVVLCTADLTVVDSVEVPTPAARGGRAMIRAALDALALLQDRVPSRLLGVGVGAAGVVDTRTEHTLVASDSFTAWAGFPVTATIEQALGASAFLDNDVNAFLRGEVAKGAVAGERHVLGMTLGTGAGGALWMNGALLDGPHGAAGETGHMLGLRRPPVHLRRPRPSGDARLGLLHHDAVRRADGTEPHRTGVAEAAAEGDAAALAVFEVVGAGVARGILITAGLAGLTTFVIGGGVSGAWQLLEPPILAALAAEPPVSGQPIRVVRASVGSRGVALGAASRARTELGAVTPV